MAVAGQSQVPGPTWRARLLMNNLRGARCRPLDAGVGRPMLLRTSARALAEGCLPLHFIWHAGTVSSAWRPAKTMRRLKR